MWWNRPTSTPSPRRLRQNLGSSIADGAAYSIMVAMGETYLPAFVLALGFGEVQAGLTATIPMLAGAVLQLVAPRMIRRLGSHRRWVICCAFAQTASFIPLLAAAIIGRFTWAGVLLIATMYWAAGLGAGPAWNTWMAQVVPRRLRPVFFARRSFAAQAAVLVGLLGAGFILHYATRGNAPLFGFGILFSIALAARALSISFLMRQSEPRRPAEAELRVTILNLWQRFRHADGRLLTYMLAVQTGSYLAAPFFTPFMLSQLKMPYATYVILMALAFLAKIVALPLVGRFAQHHDVKTLLWIGGAGVIPLAGLWALSTAPLYLAALQIVGGVAWACYELATFLLLFEAIRDDERTSMLTSFTVVNAFAITAGSAIGGIILRLAGEDYNAYVLLFAVSTAIRLTTLVLLRRVAEPPRVRVWAILRPLTIRPSAGSIDRPILMPIPATTHPSDDGGGDREA